MSKPTILLSQIDKHKRVKEALAKLSETHAIDEETKRQMERLALQDDFNFARLALKKLEYKKDNPPKKYIATSTADFPEGEGKQVWYDRDEAKYHGYGVDDEVDQEEVVD